MASQFDRCLNQANSECVNKEVGTVTVIESKWILSFEFVRTG